MCNKGVAIFSRNFDDRLSSNFHRCVILCICWDTPSEKTGLWQIPMVSSVFKHWFCISVYVGLNMDCLRHIVEQTIVIPASICQKYGICSFCGVISTHAYKHWSAPLNKMCLYNDWWDSPLTVFYLVGHTMNVPCLIIHYNVKSSTCITQNKAVLDNDVSLLGSNPTRVICLWFCSQDSGKYWVYSANTHRCMGKNQNDCSLSPDVNLTSIKMSLMKGNCTGALF